MLPDDLSHLPVHVQAQEGHRRKNSRAFRRGRAKARRAAAVDHHAAARSHLKHAHAAPTSKAALGHLFKALSSLKKAGT